MNAEALALRSIAANERDHHERPELAAVIEAAADSIERLTRERDEWEHKFIALGRAAMIVGQ